MTRPGRRILTKDIDFLDISTRTKNVLRRNNINKVSELAMTPEIKIFNFDGIGRESIHKLRDALYKHRLCMSMDRAYVEGKIK